MIVAKNSDGTVVDVRERIGGQRNRYCDSKQAKANRLPEESEGFQCLNCGGLLMIGDDGFAHIDEEDCWGSAGTTDEHQTATQLAALRLSQLLGSSRSIQSESRVGSSSDFVIADVLADWPEQLAVEVVSNCSHIGLSRKLSKLYAEGYAVFLIVVETGRYNPNRVEHHLRAASGFEDLTVGRFGARMEISLGTKLTPTTLPARKLRDNNSLPKYLR